MRLPVGKSRGSLIEKFLVRAGWLPFVLLAGCSPVGPDFVRPAAPGVQQYTEGKQPQETASAPTRDGAAQVFQAGADIPAQWWQLFHSSKLNALIDNALHNSPTIAAAQGALENAREYAAAERGNLLFPAVDAKLGETRQRISPQAFGFAGSPSTFSLTNASVGVSYTLDFFGANRRQLEGLDAQAEAQANLLRAAQVTLAANIATTAIREAALRSQIRASDAVLAAEQKTLDIMQARERLGAISETEVQQQRATLAQTLATIPGLERQLAQTRHQLAVYVGKFPGDAQLPEFELDELRLPEKLPVSLPSALVHQRPDILVSEAQLHQATASLGMTIAGVYPSVTLSASYGAMALVPGSLLNPGSTVWNLGTNLAQPLFHGGALEAGKRAAEAALDQAAAQYRQTVLNAFQNVADVLRALETDATTLAAESDNARASTRSLELARVQYENGGASFLTLLVAEEHDNQARISLIQAQSARLADSAALFLAMGGGWWNQPDSGTPRISQQENQQP
ncbi:MAG: efflux transporter outer membrane subunit [Betaproteobacteria bacterium]|nr:efflux transporter outer membrane subunit [Betaproteobacteria bacterium]